MKKKVNIPKKNAGRKLAKRLKELGNQKPTELEKAINTLQKALKEDPGYRWGWQSSIAMSFYDNYVWSGKPKSKKGIHEVANKAADYFLDLLCKS